MSNLCDAQKIIMTALKKIGNQGQSVRPKIEVPQFLATFFDHRHTSQTFTSKIECKTRLIHNIGTSAILLLKGCMNVPKASPTYSLNLAFQFSVPEAGDLKKSNV